MNWKTNSLNRIKNVLLHQINQKYYFDFNYKMFISKYLKQKLETSFVIHVVQALFLIDQYS